LSAAPAIRPKRPRDPKAKERQQRHRDRVRMEKLGVRYVDGVPIRREVIGAAVTLGLVHSAAVNDDLRAAHDIAALLARVIDLARQYATIASFLKMPPE
jgi:hypothetical protein